MDTWNQDLRNGTVINDEIKECVISENMVERGITGMEKAKEERGQANVKYVAHLDTEITEMSGIGVYTTEDKEPGVSDLPN